MAQILDLSKRFTRDQIETASQSNRLIEDPPADGYVCKIVDAILNDDPQAGRFNIELHVDIAEGKFAGYYQQLEDRFGFWGLKGYMSFKESQLPRFQQTCAALCNCNPGLVFNPFAPGGADIDSLKGKAVGVVIGKEEYESKSGDVREKNVVSYFTETDRIKNKKFKIPAIKKLAKQETKRPEFDASFQTLNNEEEVPF